MTTIKNLKKATELFRLPSGTSLPKVKDTLYLKKLEDRIRKMKINDTDDFWECLCGNTPTESGFYPCDTEGKFVEPTPEEWTTNWYACDECGRIIDQETMEIKGV